MPNLLTKISTWFKPQPKPTLKPEPNKPVSPKPINHRKYRQLIHHLEKAMSQNEKQRRLAC